MELVGNELRASVELANVRTIEAGPDPGTFHGFPRLSRSRVLALQLLSGWGLASNPGVPADVLKGLEPTLSFVAVPASL